jgi:hypothetical protein
MFSFLASQTEAAALTGFFGVESVDVLALDTAPELSADKVLAKQLERHEPKLDRLSKVQHQPTRGWETMALP